MAVSMLRVTMHPWCWWVIVRRALVDFRQGDKALGLENRRRMAGLLKTLDDGLDPDNTILESPFARLSKMEMESRATRNAELMREAGGDIARAKAIRDEIVDGRLVQGWRPLPAPHLSVSIDFVGDYIPVLKSAIEALAHEGSLNHEYDQGFIEAMDALSDAKKVEYKPTEAKA